MTATTTTTSQMIKVFVYGTLKRGEPNHKLLTDPQNGVSKFIAAGQTSVKYPLVIGTRYNIPFLINRPGTGNFIRGEIFSVDETMRARLDVLEDYPDFYDRELQEINADGGGVKEKCWVYILNNYPEKLLQLQMLSEYKDTAEKPYQESYEDSCTVDELMNGLS